MGESVGMMVYLAQRYGPTSLLPSDPADMARTLQLVVFSEAALGGLMNPLMATKFAAPDEQKSSWTQGFCQARVGDGLDYAVSLLDDREYFVGDDLTLADIAITTTLGMWRGALDQVIPGPLAAHRERMAARPAYQARQGEAQRTSKPAVDHQLLAGDIAALVEPSQARRWRCPPGSPSRPGGPPSPTWRPGPAARWRRGSAPR